MKKVFNILIEIFYFMAFSVFLEGAIIENQRLQRKTKSTRFMKKQNIYFILKQLYFFMKLSINRYQLKYFYKNLKIKKKLNDLPN